MRTRTRNQIGIWIGIGIDNAIDTDSDKSA